MGVPQSYYARFAAWLAARGHVGADLRLSRQRRVAARIAARARRRRGGLGASMRRRRCAGPRRASSRRAAAWIGHSPAGDRSLFPITASRAKVVTVAAGAGYWRENVPALRKPRGSFWYLLVPLTVPALGYFLAARSAWSAIRRAARRAVAQVVSASALRAGRRGGRRRALRARHGADHLALVHRRRDDVGREHRLAAPRLRVGACTMKRVAPADLGVARIGHPGFFMTTRLGAL